MAAFDRVEIVDRDGWRKEFPLQKKLVHIGSDPGNDIVLSAARSSQVAQRHLQLITISGVQRRYRVVNLSANDIYRGETGTDGVLSARSAIEVKNGEHLQVGDVTLIFHLGQAEVDIAAPVQARTTSQASPAATYRGRESSSVIGLRLSLPDNRLRPDRLLHGILVVSNLGNEPAVQFTLELEGLEANCYELGAGPILFPGVEKGVDLQIEHSKGPNPPAGRHLIHIHATAPEAYPGERTTVSSEIQVLPFYHHTLQLMERG
jgi:hypothetical protein